MSLSQLVFRSMLKNMKQYFLYFFALIFSVTLYFSFVALQYNQAVIEEAATSERIPAGFEAATYMLYFIVLFFVLYANLLFIKRRSKEIGMYQLIGMTKGLIFRLIALENIVLFAGAVLIGMILGFLSSRLFAMILLKLLEQSVVVEMVFSEEAVVKTVVVFTILLVIILIQMAWMIRRVTLLDLFTASKQADQRVKHFSYVKMVIGAIGIVLIAYGYHSSAKLFDVYIERDELFLNMMIILATTIGGTFLFFRFSVSFVMNLLRLKKNGHLSTVDVFAVTPIMHRMKGNAKSLTLITVLTAVSLAITALSYIAYYSIDKDVQRSVPADYILIDPKMDVFLTALEQESIGYEMDFYHISYVTVQRKELGAIPSVNDYTIMPVIPLSDYRQIDEAVTLQENEVIVESYYGDEAEMYPIEPGKELTVRLETQEEQTPEKVTIKEVRDEPILGGSGSASILVVSDKKFEQYKRHDITQSYDFQKSIFLKNRQDIERAEQIYKEYRQEVEEGAAEYAMSSTQKEELRYLLGTLGVRIFTAAFLGLAFLLATGSILYFKQTAEADEEAPSYTIMRKIGFSEQELMRGIYAKQLFNFGVPLLIGLLHSYFAVKSGWFLFGSELVAPMLITMALYIAMYIAFALLSISYYRKVIRDTL